MAELLITFIDEAVSVVPMRCHLPGVSMLSAYTVHPVSPLGQEGEVGVGGGTSVEKLYPLIWFMSRHHQPMTQGRDQKAPL